MIKDTDKKKEAMTRIEMRISKDDKAIIEQKARKTGLTTLLQEYSMQLGKIGSNLNQIARCFNQGFISDSLRGEVREACRELLNLKFRILPALEDVVCGKKYQKKTKSTASGKESG